MNMGRIMDRIKRKTWEHCEDEKHPTDILQEMDIDEMGFTIIRNNGNKLIYDGESNTFEAVKPDKVQ